MCNICKFCTFKINFKSIELQSQQSLFSKNKSLQNFPYLGFFEVQQNVLNLLIENSVNQQSEIFKLAHS